MKRNIYKTLDSLVDDREPIATKMVPTLSNLTREEQKALQNDWENIALDKRRRLINLMNEQADDDIHMDFRAVFCHGLTDLDAEIRRLCIDALWEDESISLIRPFLILLRRDSDTQVRASAAAALGRYVLKGELEEISAERLALILEALIQTFNEPFVPLEIRRRIVEALGYSSDSRVPEIISRAYEEPLEKMRLSAIHAMGRSADDYWNGTVRAELYNEEATFRFEAARAAGELGDSVAVPRLAELAKNNDPEVQEMAVWALGEIGGELARKTLLEVVKDDNRSLRRVARNSLAQLILLDDENLSPLPLSGLADFVDHSEEEENDEQTWAEDEWRDEEDEDEDEEDEWGNEQEWNIDWQHEA